MFPKGTIYKQGFPSRGEKFLHPKFLMRLGYDLARGVGAGLIGFAFISFLFVLAPVVREEINYKLAKQEKTNFGSLLRQAEAEQKEAVRAEAESLGVSSYFSIVVPKIGAKSEIIANTNAADEVSYLEALKNGVAHARGTHFPGQGERIFLFSHSTDSPFNFARYNAVFYLLGKLGKGDRIIIFFADTKYEYEVIDKRFVVASDTSWLTGESGTEELVLQTCDPPGTSWRRLLILAKPIKRG